MKCILIMGAVFLLFTAPAFSELTVKDIEKIQEIVDKSEKRLKEYVDKSEERLKEYVDKKENIAVSERDKRWQNIAILAIALVAFITVVIGIRQIIVARQNRNIVKDMLK